jgi:hypothetical protein
MCIPVHQLDPPARRLRNIANAALIFGLLPWIFREHMLANPSWLRAWCGILCGISIAINLIAFRGARRCGGDGNAQ